MSETLHDALAAEAQARETIEHDTEEIETKLEDIRWWYPQIADTMLTIGSQALDLTGIRGTTSRIPGGDALAMRGPWSAGYDEPDDLPHPAQVIREWADRWREATRTPPPASAKWATHLAILQANTGWFVRQDRSNAFKTDIRALWGRLAALTGNSEPHPEPEPPTTDHVWTALEQNPDHELTRRDLTHLGINPSTLTTWRHRGKITETRPGRYRAGDILNARRTA